MHPNMFNGSIAQPKQFHLVFLAEVILPGVDDAGLHKLGGVQFHAAANGGSVAEGPLEGDAHTGEAVVKSLVHPHAGGMVAHVVHDKVDPTVLVEVCRGHNVRIQVVDVVHLRAKGSNA